MSRYLLRRLLIAVPSLIGISIVLFTVLALAPGDPFGELATNPNVPAEVGAALRAKFGLDDPIWLRYVRWFMAMLHGDWGFSFVSRMDVDRLILQRLPATLLVIGSSQVLALLIALPVGVLAATRPYSIFYQVANTFAFIGFSLPTFFTGRLLIPVVTLVALSMPAVFGGAIVTEQIFRIPGIGSLLISSILANDTPVIMAVTFVFACLVILFNLFADILYGWLDPRISYR